MNNTSENKKSSKKKIVIIIAAIVLAVVALGVGAFFLIKTLMGNDGLFGGLGDSTNTAGSDTKCISYEEMIETLETAYDTELEAASDSKEVSGKEAVLEVMKVNGLIPMKAAMSDADLTDEKIVKYSVELGLVSESLLDNSITQNDLDQMIEMVKEFNFSDAGIKDYECIELKEGTKELPNSEIASWDKENYQIIVNNGQEYQVGDYLLLEDEDGIKLARQVDEIIDGGLISLVNADYSDVLDKYEAQETLHITPATMQEYVTEAGGELLFVEPISENEISLAEANCADSLIANESRSAELLYVEPMKECKLADLGLSGDGAIPLMGDEILADASWALEFSYVSSNDFAESDTARASLTIYDYELQVKYGYVVPLDGDQLGAKSFTIKLDVIDELKVTAHADLINEKKASVIVSGKFNLDIYINSEKTIDIPIPALNYGGSILGVIKAQAGLSYFTDLNGELDVTIKNIAPYFDMEVDLDTKSVSFPKSPEPKDELTISWEAALSVATGLRLGFDVKAGDFRIAGGSYLGVKIGVAGKSQDDGCVCINGSVDVPYIKAAVLVSYPNFGAKSTGTLNISKELDPIKSFTNHYEIKLGEKIIEVEKCSYGDEITPVEFVTGDAEVGQQIMDTTVSMALNAYADYFTNFVNSGSLHKEFEGDEYYFYNPELGKDEEIWFGLAYLNDDYIPEFIYGINSENYGISGSQAIIEKAKVLTYSRGQVVKAGELGMRGKFSYVPKENGMLSYEVAGAVWSENGDELRIYKMDGAELVLQSYRTDIALENASNELFSNPAFTTYYERGRLTSQNLEILRTDEWWIFLDSDENMSDLHGGEDGNSGGNNNWGYQAGSVSAALNAYADYFDDFVKNAYMHKEYEGDEYYYFKPEIDDDLRIWFGLAYLNDDYIPEFIYGINEDYCGMCDSDHSREKATVLTYSDGQVVEAGSLGSDCRFYYLPMKNEMVASVYTGNDIISPEGRVVASGVQQLIFKMDGAEIVLQDYETDDALKIAVDEFFADSSYAIYSEHGELTSVNLSILRTEEWWRFLDSNHNTYASNMEWENSVLLGNEFEVDLDDDGVLEQIAFEVKPGYFYQESKWRFVLWRSFSE